MPIKHIMICDISISCVRCGALKAALAAGYRVVGKNGEQEGDSSKLAKALINIVNQEESPSR